MKHHIGNLVIILFAFSIYGCAASGTMAGLEELEPASVTPDSLLSLIPDYSAELHTITGKGRALVSEPGNSDRVTVEFQSNRERSLLTIRTGIGVEAGQILVEQDSLLIYNKVDKIARKVSPEQSNLSSVGSIASLNMLDLFNFRINGSEIERIFQDGDQYAVLLKNNVLVHVDRKSGLVIRVDRSESVPPIPYQSIDYEGYARINGFQLPRKITIFSGDGRSRATFLVQQLDVNGKLPPLRIDLPEDIPIYRP